MKRIIHTEKAPAAIGPYSQAVVNGGFMFISGQVPVNPESGKIEAADIKDQTDQVLKNLQNILKSENLNMNCVVKTTVLMADLKDFSVMNEVYGSYFSDNPPARATFQVAALPLGALIEIDAVAVIEEN